MFVSAASVWESELKKRTGKLTFASTIIQISDENGFSLLDVSPADGSLAGSLDWVHKDPFDRMLIAQALERGLAVVTADDAMRTAPGVRFL
jgi:PIN domain nuclease of toxin-antitoxin system